MPIRSRILIPMLLLVAATIALAVFAGMNRGRDYARVALVTGNTIEAADLSRKANQNFDRLDALVAEVAAMTHFIQPGEIDKRFQSCVDAISADLDGLKASTLSLQMGEVAQATIERFKHWRLDAQAVLGLRPAQEIVAPDVLKRAGDALRGDLDHLLSLSGTDARAGVVEIGLGAAQGARFLLIAAVLVGCWGRGWRFGNRASLRDRSANWYRAQKSSLAEMFRSSSTPPCGATRSARLRAPSPLSATTSSPRNRRRRRRPNSAAWPTTRSGATRRRAPGRRASRSRSSKR